MQNPGKRKAFIAGFPEGVRPVKRRAAKACQTCRSRKVRCDVVESGPPCNNCRLDQVPCIVSDSRRKRKPRSNGVGEESQSPVSSVAETDGGDLKSSSSDSALGQLSPTNDAGALFPCNSASNSFELEIHHHVPHMLCQYCLIARSPAALMEADRTQGHRLSHDERIRRISLSTAQATHGVCLLLDAERNNQTHKRTSVERYQQSMEVLKRLREIYMSAASATSLLQAAIRRPETPNSLSPQTSNMGVHWTKNISAPVLTPPPDTDAPDPHIHSSIASEQLRPSWEDSPPASEESIEFASSTETAPSDGMNEIVGGDIGLDTDFDALFNLDADMDFLAAHDNEDTMAALSSNAEELSRGVEWTTLNAASGSATIPGFSHQRRLDLVTDSRVSVQA
jgi:Fungal Zn(2)-Cys(6) binuclear cluster domain